MKIGILSLQGDFEAHAEALRRVGADPVEVRHAEEFSSVEGLILPGGRKYDGAEAARPRGVVGAAG